MADPVLVDFFRVQAIFQGTTGLPEDVYVNSFVFRNDTGGGVESTVDTIADRLRDFYDLVHPASTGSITGLMSNDIVETTLTIKAYDLGQQPPRVPHERTRELIGISSSSPLPHEVALCLSYYADRNLPRQRGRIYIGPLAVNAVDSGAASRARPITPAVDTLAAAGTFLADEGVGGVNWHVLSQVDAEAREITGGWVDNAFDTQRRRGIAPSGRTDWGAPPT